MKRKTINNNISHIAYFATACVRQNGRIFPWGGFRVLDKEDDDPADNTSGLYCWCQKLIDYPTEKYKVEVVFDTLMIIDRTNENIVKTFEIYGEEVEVFVPTIEFFKISSEGLFTDPDEKIENLFFTFDKKYGGLDVVKISFEKGMKPLSQSTAEDYIIITTDGEIIPFIFSPKKNLEFVS
jgi:hypothetical protein